MEIKPFSISRLPRIEFGAGSFSKVPALCAQLGKTLLLVTGAKSFRATEKFGWLIKSLKYHNISISELTVSQEPSPDLIDQAVADLQEKRIDVVLGIGGGSALDAAKAIAGLLKPGNSVRDHLEEVGKGLLYKGPATPFIAVPTTAGTGSEATKNAVLSLQGPNGFKKSFRAEQLVALYAVVDPDLVSPCPKELIAADGLDAVAQLLEAFVSVRANCLTDVLALSGLTGAKSALLKWYQGGPAESQAQTAMAYAALLSGITLAQAGLGAVHGFAAPLGAYFPVAHGVACGTLLAAVTERNILALRAREPDHPALFKYAVLGRLFKDDEGLPDLSAQHYLIDVLYGWIEALHLPRLHQYGVLKSDIPRIVSKCRGGSMKTNPIVLTDAELEQILLNRL